MLVLFGKPRLAEKDGPRYVLVVVRLEDPKAHFLRGVNCPVNASQHFAGLKR